MRLTANIQKCLNTVNKIISKMIDYLMHRNYVIENGNVHYKYEFD